MNKPKIVVVCGSSKFVAIMAACSWLIECNERAITMSLHLLPRWYTDIEHHLAEHEDISDAMDELHLRKIDLCDEIFVVNFDDYIGESTANEIEYAKINNIPIRWYMDDYIGEQVTVIMAENSKQQPEQEDKKA